MRQASFVAVADRPNFLISQGHGITAVTEAIRKGKQELAPAAALVEWMTHHCAVVCCQSQLQGCQLLPSLAWVCDQAPADAQAFSNRRIMRCRLQHPACCPSCVHLNFMLHAGPFSSDMHATDLSRRADRTGPQGACPLPHRLLACAALALLSAVQPEILLVHALVLWPCLLQQKRPCWLQSKKRGHSSPRSLQHKHACARSSRWSTRRPAQSRHGLP